MWIKLKAFFARLFGHGPCFACGQHAHLSWIHERYKSADGKQEIDYRAKLCQTCLSKRTTRWTKWMDDTWKEFDKVFEGFDKKFER